MLKYCLNKWNSNKDKLKAKIRKDKKIYECGYKYLVKLVVDIILNEGKGEGDYHWDSDEITEIDNGDYQGTLLFLIPMEVYQPSEYEYLMTYVGYGSCSGCDTLQHIQSLYWPGDDNEKLKEKALKEYMSLCKDILTNMIKPYNTGWRQDDRFEVVTMEAADEN